MKFWCKCETGKSDKSIKYILAFCYNGRSILSTERLSSYLPGCVTGSPLLKAACGIWTVKLKTGPVLSTMFSRRWVDLNKFPVCISDVSDGPSINGVASSTPHSATKKGIMESKKRKKIHYITNTDNTNPRCTCTNQNITLYSHVDFRDASKAPIEPLAPIKLRVSQNWTSMFDTLNCSSGWRVTDSWSEFWEKKNFQWC